MQLLWIFVLGIIVGVVLTTTVIGKPKGKLRIDMSDPTEDPYLFLELSCPLRNVIYRNYILLKVSREDFLSQK